jgi:hypothetical protein
VLGADEQHFQYQVRRGLIHKTVLPGKTQGVYSKHEVDTLAGNIEAAIIAGIPEGIEFRKATLDDLEAEYELSYLIFGKGAHTLEVRRGFLEHNTEVDYHLYDQGELVAFIHIIPFNHKTIEAFTNGEIRGWEIGPENTEQFAPNTPLKRIIMEMITTPTVPPKKRGFYGSQLLKGLAEVLAMWGDHGIIIKKLYATSSTQTGIHILSTAGFHVLYNLGRGRFSFELDVETSKTQLIRNYREALNEWREKQEAPKTRSRKPTKSSAEIEV